MDDLSHIILGIHVGVGRTVRTVLVFVAGLVRRDGSAVDYVKAIESGKALVRLIPRASGARQHTVRVAPESSV